MDKILDKYIVKMEIVGKYMFKILKFILYEREYC